MDGKAKRNPSISYSASYKQWRVARLDGHLAYTASGEGAFWEAGPWSVYKKAVAPARSGAGRENCVCPSPT